ncbi:type II toxin-antitoxin system Phd/YefM family antitoxin [Microgenomates group bacterium]|nr:type II toxin-antitoxin system Phd/YefM family antitoxin [Microgenomates group bacterium]
MLTKTIKTVDLINDFKRVSDFLEANVREWITISRPHNKNMVIMSEQEAARLAKTERNLAYLQKLDESIEDVREHGGYEFDVTTKQFNNTSVRVNI